MRKISIIIVLCLLAQGCSVTRKVSYDYLADPNNALNADILESVKSQNISNNSFFIQKAEVEILNKNRKDKFIANIKFQKPDKYLISLKSKSGIEGARIYITDDTIMVNDRINKKMYVGNSLYLKRNFGLNQKLFPVIFGDMILEKRDKEYKEICENDKLTVNSSFNGITLRYEINCKRRKVILVQQIDNIVKQEVEIKYGKFLNFGNCIIPGNIELDDIQYNTKIYLKILKFEYPWNGSINFIPGKGYELIELV